MTRDYALQFFTPEQGRIEYERLLRLLIPLTEEGMNDSPEADALREQMDLPWYAMTDEDHKVMVALAVTLIESYKGAPCLVRIKSDG